MIERAGLAVLKKSPSECLNISMASTRSSAMNPHRLSARNTGQDFIFSAIEGSVEFV